MTTKKALLAAGLVLAAAVVGAAVFLLLPSGGEDHPATVVEVANQVDVYPRPTDDWRPAASGMEVFGGGQVRTGTGSSARLELLSGVVRLSAETLFTVKASATRQGTLATTLFLQEGRLWANLTTDQPHDFAIETGNAVAAVRDTRFSVQATDGRTLVSVAAGEVTLTAQGQMVTVRAGQQAIVLNGQPPSLAEPMGNEERALWATEGEMPELAPPTPTPTPTETPTSSPTPTATPTAAPTETSTLAPTRSSTPSPSPTAAPTRTPTPTLAVTPVPTATPTRKPTPTPTEAQVQINMECDVSSYLWGPAGDPASRAPETEIKARFEGANAAQVIVELPNGQIFALPSGNLYDKGGWFDGPRELPQAGGTYTCTALDARGVAIPGAVTSDVYLGGYEPDPPFNVQAQMVDAGILITWNAPPVIPGAFDPGASPPLGWYHISLAVPLEMGTFGWTQGSWSVAETSHLVPFRRQDFGPGDWGQGLEEMADGVYDLAVHAASVAPSGTAGHGRECQARDTGEDIRVTIEGGQIRVEKP